MQRLLAKRGKRAFDSLACELVPEGHRRVIQGQHAAGEAFLQRQGSRTQNCFQKPALGSVGDDRSHF